MKTGKVFHFTFSLVMILSLSACNFPVSAPTTQPPADGTVTPVLIDAATPAPNPVSLAGLKPASASNSLEKSPPQNAVDGTPLTRWDSGGVAPQWIQIDLENIATLRGIRLIISQSANGETTHQVLAGNSPLGMKLVHEFSGSTSDSQVLEFTVDPPMPDVRFIQILTTQSPSAVSWKEIDVLGYPGKTIPTPTPQKEIAEVIYINGQILTMEKDQPIAEAIALKGAKILAVGSQDEVLSYQGYLTKVVDLQGMTLLPGFIDSHAHRIGDRNLYGNNTSVEDVFAATLSEGWTSIHELYVNGQRINELIDLSKGNRLPVRVSAYLAVGEGYNYVPWYKDTPYKPLQQISPFLQIAGIKITLDQEWGEKVFFDQQQLDAMVSEATSRGWQVAIHAFSPKANDEALNAYERALNGSSNDTLRLRLEHTGVMTDAEVQKMAGLGIIGSVQLINASMWSQDASFKKYIPAGEVQHSARWRDMLNAGIFLIGNTDDPWCCTDWRNGFRRPADTPTVIQAIYQGVTRNNFFDRKPESWQVAQILTVDETLHMLTINNAYASHQDDVLGSLIPGKYADLVILSANPLTTPVDQIPAITVVMTMVGGQAKYCTAGHADVCVSTTP